MKIKNIVYTAFLCGIMCVLSPITIPLGPVPITLTTLLIYIFGAVYDTRISTISVILYIAIGCAGLPVFSGMSGGIGQILGPTGGFIIGYIPLAACVSILAKKSTYIPSMILGTIILYTTGSIWYIAVTDSSIFTAITVCVLPFIIGDITKIILATLLVPKLQQIINKI